MNAALLDVMTDHYMGRLTRPLLNGWHIVMPADSAAYSCDECTERASFIRIQADDCNVWGLAGIDGAHSDAYGIYCHKHSGITP